jgi:Type II CAAX prenyl endopeptidase Rce1-like
MAFASSGLSRHPLGLSLFAHDLRYPLATTLAIGVLVGVLVCVADIFVFASVFPADYLQLVHDMPTAERILFVGGVSLLDEITFRLGVMTALVWAATRLWRPTNGIYWGAIVSAQLINVLAHGTSLATPMEVLFSLVRIELPGILWGYLYWRHGFSVAALAHTSSHIIVQPVLTLSF